MSWWCIYCSIPRNSYGAVKNLLPKSVSLLVLKKTYWRWRVRRWRVALSESRRSGDPALPTAPQGGSLGCWNNEFATTTTTTTTGGGQRRLRLRRGPISFFSTRCSREKNLLIPAAAGFSPSMQHLVFWPHAGAWGAGVILPPCAQLLWCALYVMKSTHKVAILQWKCQRLLASIFTY